MDNPTRQCAREILETTPLVMRFIREQIRRHPAAGLLLPQFRALAFVDRTPNTSLSTVAGHLGLSLPAMSRLINGLVGRKLVERQTVSTNRRQIALTLTARGRAALEKGRGEIRPRLAEVLEAIPAREKKAVLRAMRMLREIFEKQPVARCLVKRAAQP